MSEIVQQPRIEQGSWVECALTTCDKMFFRHVLGEKYYGVVGDKIGVCPLCIHVRKMENKTLPKRRGNVSEFVHHTGADVKPESDSL